MRLQILSDLHLEMSACDIPVAGDVVVLAGDIHIGTAGVEWAIEHFSERPVVYVAGNHEYYGGGVFPDLIDRLRDVASGSNVHVLENDQVVIDGVRFLGTTLWTDFCLFGRARYEGSWQAVKHAMTDYSGQIRRADGHLLHPKDTEAAHVASLAWLRERLREAYDGPSVVVTHHAATLFSTHPAFRSRPVTAGYVSNLDSIIQMHQPDIWINGHTHMACDLRIGSTRLLSNPRGYKDGEVQGFDPAFVVEV